MHYFDKKLKKNSKLIQTAPNPNSPPPHIILVPIYCVHVIFDCVYALPLGNQNQIWIIRGVFQANQSHGPGFNRLFSSGLNKLANPRLIEAGNTVGRSDKWLNSLLKLVRTYVFLASD